MRSWFLLPGTGYCYGATVAVRAPHAPAGPVRVARRSTAPSYSEQQSLCGRAVWTLEEAIVGEHAGACAGRQSPPLSCQWLAAQPE